MKNEKSFFDDFKTAVFGFDQYTRLTQRTLDKAVMFVVVICFVAGLLAILPFAVKYSSVGGIAGIINDKVEQFYINNNELWTEQEYDGEVETDIISDVYVKIKPNDNYNDEDISDIDKELLFFGMYKDKMVIRCYNEKRVIENSVLELMGIKDKQGLIIFINVVQACVFIVLLLYYTISCVLELAFVWLMTRAICTVVEKNIGKEDLFKICAYARTMPVLLFSVLIMLGGFSGGLSQYISMKYPIYLAVYAVYIFIAVKNYDVKKAQKNSSADETPNDENGDDKSVICDFDNFDSSKFE